MGWGTTFKTEIYLNRKKYDNIQQLNAAIEETQKDIQYYREKILMQCIGGTIGFDFSNLNNNPADEIHSTVSVWLEEYDRAQSLLYDLLLFRDDWDEREQKFITAEVD